MAQETGKQRAARMPLDYYKQPDRLERWKRRLLWLAFLLPVGWFGYSLLRGNAGQGAYSRGPVAAVHATWDDNCAACHVSFQPISGEAWLGPAHADAGRCETCHAGPPHHDSQQPEATATCAGCHREHRGRDASLVRLADSDCTGCHQGLAAHMKAGFEKHYQDVSRFDKNHHPEFKVLRDKASDPGKLKFSHARHLAAGMKLPGGGELFTLDRLPLADRDRYRLKDQQETDPVQLDCAACHQLDSGSGRTGQKRDLASELAAPAAGAYMLPIRYAEHCRACHPLTLPANGQTLTVPHHLQPDDVKKFLWGTYAERYLARKPAPAQPAGAARPLPGKHPADPKEETRVRKEIEQKVADAEKALYRSATTCGECHHYEAREGQAAPQRIVPPRVPEVWFTSAKFDHSAHRAASCRVCHERAFPDSAEPSTKSEDVLLPGIDTCLACHAPAHGAGANLRGGARFDCTECHRYHNGDAARLGIGAPERGVSQERKLDLHQFLSGGQER